MAQVVAFLLGFTNPFGPCSHTLAPRRKFADLLTDYLPCYFTVF